MSEIDAGGRLSASRGHSRAARTLAMFALLFARPVFAQTGEPNPFAPADTSSPRSMLTTFIRDCNEIQELRMRGRYFDRNLPEHRALARRITDCLDASEMPEYARRESLAQAAICLKEVLDRVELPPENEIPGPDDLENEDGEVLDRWQVPGTQIVIGRAAEGPQMHEYVFTPATVRRAVELYEDMAGLPYRDDGPDVSPGLYRWYMSAPADPTVGALVARFPPWTQKRFLDLAVWQWVAVTLAVVVALLLFALIYRLQRTRAARFRGTSLWRYFLTLWFPLAAVLIPIGFRHFTRQYLGVHGDPYLVISFAANLVALLALIVVIFAVGNRITEAIISSPHINPQGLDAQFIRIVGKLTALIVSIVVFLQGGGYLGIPLTTLLASAGVGGLAVALAAQDAIKNVFGTFVLMADKPFRVGERIVIKNYDGVVESIGLRSTRMRLLTGHQVTVPNDELARSDIENVGRRPYLRRLANVQVPLDTPREKIEAAVEKIRTALENHEGMAPHLPPRVYFNEFNPDAFNVLVIYWYHPPDYWKYLAFSEQVNHEICSAFEEQGVKFVRAVRVAADGGNQPLIAAEHAVDAH